MISQSRLYIKGTARVMRPVAQRPLFWAILQCFVFLSWNLPFASAACTRKTDGGYECCSGWNGLGSVLCPDGYGWSSDWGNCVHCYYCSHGTYVAQDGEDRNQLYCNEPPPPPDTGGNGGTGDTYVPPPPDDVCGPGLMFQDAYPYSGFCTACPQSTWKSVTGNVACTLCVNSGHLLTGQISPCACICNAGYSFDANCVCTTCPVGYWFDANYVCTTCPVNTYKATTGSAACTVCAAGSYSALGASSCNLCSAGKNLLGGSTCVDCAAGKFSAAGASGCTSCAAVAAVLPQQRLHLGMALALGISHRCVTVLCVCVCECECE